MYVFPPHEVPTVPVEGGGEFPVRRIFCVGKNYSEHVKEMGGDAKTDPPVFFTKPADAVVASKSTIPYPPGTNNLHYEGELVVAMKSSSDIFGYAAGCDLTRRDLQSLSKENGAPWDIAKGFDRSAPIAAIVQGELNEGAELQTLVNGKLVQSSPLSSMIWSVAEILASLNDLFEIKAGDLIFTGTPSGVGPIEPGDHVDVTISTLPKLEFDISAS